MIETISLPDLDALLESRKANRLQYPGGSAALLRDVRRMVAYQEQIMDAWIARLRERRVEVDPPGMTALLSADQVRAAVSDACDGLDEMKLVRLALNPMGLAQLRDAIRAADDPSEKWIDAFAEDGAESEAPVEDERPPLREPSRKVTHGSPFLRPVAFWGLATAAGVALSIMGWMIVKQRNELAAQRDDNRRLVEQFHQIKPNPSTQGSDSRPFNFTSDPEGKPLNWIGTLRMLSGERDDPNRMLELLAKLSPSYKDEIARRRKQNPTATSRQVLDGLYKDWGKPEEWK